eukprot:2102332-Rhodomonas_salina.1
MRNLSSSLPQSSGFLPWSATQRPHNGHTTVVALGGDDAVAYPGNISEAHETFQKIPETFQDFSSDLVAGGERVVALGGDDV